MNISILLPTRNRPGNLKRFVDSFYSTAKNPELIETLLYIDNDDIETQLEVNKLKNCNIKTNVGERIIMSEMSNILAKQSCGDILFTAGDDLVCRTSGWDELVIDEFEKVPDKILVVHGDDLLIQPPSRFGTHLFVSKEWVNVLDYVVPGIFVSDYADNYINDVANGIGRRVFLPNLIIEHMHFTVGKAEVDDNTRDRLARLKEHRPDQLYFSFAIQQQKYHDICKLNNFIQMCKTATLL